MKKRATPSDSSSSEEDIKRAKTDSSSSSDVEMDDSFGFGRYEKKFLRDQVKLTLLQREAVRWMTEREEEAGGGLLLDEMGLGKTLSVLFTIACEKKQSSCSEPTLVVCPPIVFEAWEGEIATKFRGKILSVARYGASDDRASMEDAKNGDVPRGVDIVLTTYNRLFLDLQNHLSHKANMNDDTSIGNALLSGKNYQRNNRAMLLTGMPQIARKIDPELLTIRDPIATKGLFSVRWSRIVMDEAHKACNSETNTFRAAMCLSADRRWWVTGTPLQNKYSDAVAALLFVREPSVCLERSAVPVREHRPDPVMTDQEYRASQAFAEWSFGRTIQGVMDQHEDMIRNDPVLSYMATLEFHKFEHAVKFKHEEERKAHHSHVRRLRRVAQLLSEKTGESGLIPLGKANGFDSKAAPKDADDIAADKEVDQMIKEGKKESEVLMVFWTRARQIAVDLTLAGEPPLPNGALSTKMQMLVDDVKSKVPKEDKFLVFSEWVSALEIAADALKTRGIEVLTFHGKMLKPKRREVLRRFKEDPKIRGLVMQIECGGLGLTLTSANHIFVIEPMLNPHKEQQAFGRIRRPGQTKNMICYYLLIAGSVEEVTRSISAKKLRMGATMRGSSNRKALSSIEILRDVNLLLMNGENGEAYRERDGQREYQKNLGERKKFEIPPDLGSPLSKRQIEQRERVYLGAFLAYEAIKSIPSGSVLWRLSTKQKDAADEAIRAKLEKKKEPALQIVGKQPPPKTIGVFASDSLSVVLEPLKLRGWLNEEFYKRFHDYELEVHMERAQSLSTGRSVSNFDIMAGLYHRQLEIDGRTSIDPAKANTPSDFYKVMMLVGCPTLSLHYTEELLAGERHIYGPYDASNAKFELVQAKGDAAGRLRKSSLLSVKLDGRVLMSFMPLWLKDTMFDLLPRPSLVYLDQLRKEPEKLWIAPPMARKGLEPLPLEYEILDRCAPSFLDDVKELLLPALSKAAADDDASVATLLLATISLVPAKSPNVERRLFVARSKTTGNIIAAASAVILYDTKKIATIVAPSMIVMSSLRDFPGQVTSLLLALGHKIVDSLFVGSSESFVAVPGGFDGRQARRARVYAGQKFMIDWTEKTYEGFTFKDDPPRENVIAWTQISDVHRDGFMTWTPVEAMEL